MEIRGLKEKLAQLGPTSALGLSGLAIKHAMRVEQAWMRLAAVMPLHAKDDVVAEVEHRRKLMGEPQAIESVYEDIIADRWHL